MWLTVVGGALGLLTCQWFIRAIVALAPEGIPRLDEVAIDVPVAIFSVAVMAVVTLLCGAAPIRQSGILDLAATLNDASRTIAGGRSYRTRSSLLVVQIGLAVVLLVAAGLVVRSFQALQHLDVGFQGESLLRLKVEPRGQSQTANIWIHDLLPQIAALPQVEAVGGVYLTPLELGSIGQGTWALAEGQPETSADREQQSDRELPDRDTGLLQGDAHSHYPRTGVHRRGQRQRPTRRHHQREHRRCVLPGPGSDRQTDQGRGVFDEAATRTARGEPLSASPATCAIAVSTRFSSTCTIRSCKAERRRRAWSCG